MSEYLIPSKSPEPIELPPASNYQLYVFEAPQEVKKVENLLGKIEDLKYVDHDLTDTNKFPKLQPYQYLQVVHETHEGESLIPLDWEENLHRATELNLAHIPHFGSPEVNAVVKLLLYRVHGGYLWMDSRISIDPRLIWRITRLSKKGLDPALVFVGKTKDK